MINGIRTYLLLILNILIWVYLFWSLNKLEYIRIENSINILSLISLIFTVIIAILIPTIIKKTIDDNRGIKLILIDEVKLLINTVEENHKIIESLYSDESEITQSNRDCILNNFFDAELKIDSIKIQVETSFPYHDSLTKEITENLFKYKRFLTDGKFMHSKYKTIDYDFYRESKMEFYSFRKSLMKNIHEIYKF